MKRFSTTIFLAITQFILLNCTQAADPKNGMFVSEEYLQSLSNSRSPVKAAKSLRPQSIKVEKDKKGVTFKTFEDFNEGGPVFRFENGKQPQSTEGGGLNPEFERIDSIHFIFGYKGHPKADFHYIVDLERFVSKICLEGKYSGINKEGVEFTDRGEFIVNGSNRKFTTGLYYPPSFNRDYFDSDSTEYGFSRIGDTLKIWDVTNGSLFEDGKMSKSPAMILVRKIN
jgi:hypothetical protein